MILYRSEHKTQVKRLAQWLIVTLIVGLSSIQSGYAQFKKVYVSVNGLTCSQCSRAVYNALKKTTGVSELKMDLNSTIAEINITNNLPPDPEALARAVKKAGYAIDFIELEYLFDPAKNNGNETVCDKNLCIVLNEPLTTEGTYRIRLLDISVNGNAADNAMISQIKQQKPKAAGKKVFYGRLVY